MEGTLTGAKFTKGDNVIFSGLYTGTKNVGGSFLPTFDIIIETSGFLTCELTMMYGSYLYGYFELYDTDGSLLFTSETLNSYISAKFNIAREFKKGQKIRTYCKHTSTSTYGKIDFVVKVNEKAVTINAL